MAPYSALEVASMMADSNLESSSSDSEVAEDPSFPLPRVDSDQESDSSAPELDSPPFSPAPSPIGSNTQWSPDWSPTGGKNNLTAHIHTDILQ